MIFQFKILKINLNLWNTNNATNMTDLFNNYSLLESLPDISK